MMRGSRCLSQRAWLVIMRGCLRVDGDELRQVFRNLISQNFNVLAGAQRHTRNRSPHSDSITRKVLQPIDPRGAQY